jgi:hypothetical protein
MGRGRRFDKKPRVRPKKDGCDKKRKEKVQKRRLVALGMPEDLAARLNPKQVRDFLKYPNKLDKVIVVLMGGKKKKKNA